MQEISRRNTETVEMALKDMYIKISEQQRNIESFQNTLTSFSEKINALERMLMLQKATSIGHGPSEL